MYRLTDGIEFIRSLPDQTVDGIFTDPPWGKGPAIVGQDNWLGLISEMTREAGRVLKPNGKCLIWIGMRMLGQMINAVESLEYKWTIFCLFIPPRHLAGFENNLDPIVLFQPVGAKYPVKKHMIRSLYQHVSLGRPDTKHPCARPFNTVKDMLRDWFDEGDYVIDPFAGSDTTGVACKELGLKYDTCEIDPMMYVTGQFRHKQMHLFNEEVC